MFTPPFCPYTGCTNHTHGSREKWWIHLSHHLTKSFGRVMRYRCKSCGRSFSQQTFSVHYYAKRIVNLSLVENMHSAGCGIRGIGRSLHCSRQTVQNRLDRIARQGIALHAECRSYVDTTSDICFDGLVSFDKSQYRPNDIGISITSDHQFILGISHAALRRSGRKTEVQEQQLKSCYCNLQFEHGAIKRSLTEHLQMIRRERHSDEQHPLVLHTDEKPEYTQALLEGKELKRQLFRHRLIHDTTNSQLPRTTENPLFSCNYIDREIRKDQACHCRETTRSSQNAANMMSRLYVYLVWHNYKKKYRLNEQVDRTQSHAEKGGLSPALLRERRKHFFTRRAFLSRLTLDPMDEKIWRKQVYSPEAGRIRGGYLPKFALA